MANDIQKTQHVLILSNILYVYLVLNSPINPPTYHILVYFLLHSRSHINITQRWCFYVNKVETITLCNSGKTWVRNGIVCTTRSLFPFNPSKNHYFYLSTLEIKPFGMGWSCTQKLLPIVFLRWSSKRGYQWWKVWWNGFLTTHTL